MGHAEQLWAELTSSGSAAVDRLIRDARAEAEHVDYKRATNPKDVLGKCVSAFANTSGGVILWGVDAKSFRDERSEAPAPAPCEQAEHFRADIERLLPGACDPPVPGVANHVMLIDGGPRGYVATYVPASPMAPHRDDEKIHRVRIGSACPPMPHALFATYFGKRPVPSLSLVVAVSALRVLSSGRIRVIFDFLVCNQGDGPLTDFYFSAVPIDVRADPGWEPLWGAGEARQSVDAQAGPRGSRPFAYSAFARSDYRIAPRGLASVARLAVPFDPQAFAGSLRFAGVLGAVGTTASHWQLTVVPPLHGLAAGSRPTPDDESARSVYCSQLRPEALTGGEFLHHAHARLAADHGGRPSR